MNELPAYLDLCAALGVARIECGDGFTEMDQEPSHVIEQAAARGLEVEFELGKKHGGTFTLREVDLFIEEGTQWLEAGARQLVPDVQLSNVRLEEVMRVESYRRGLHSDAFVKGTLRPRLRP